jgi:uncharacterized protein
VARPLILFAHGAGAPSTSPWMRAWAERLGALGRVVTFDYPRTRALPALVAAHAAALRAARPRGRVVLAGKSMGSRVGCHLALERPVERLVCLGYPLVGQNGKVRDQVLLDLRTPVLFVQGTRDPLCPLDLLAEVRARMTAPSALHVVDDGDHSHERRKGHITASGVSQETSDAAALAAIASFLAG